MLINAQMRALKSVSCLCLLLQSSCNVSEFQSHHHFCHVFFSSRGTPSATAHVQNIVPFLQKIKTSKQFQYDTKYLILILFKSLRNIFHTNPKITLILGAGKRSRSDSFDLFRSIFPPIYK